MMSVLEPEGIPDYRSEAIGFLSSIQLRAPRKPPPAAATHSTASTPRGSPKAGSVSPKAARSPTAASSAGASVHGGSGLASSSSLPSNMDTLEASPRVQHATRNAFDVAAWQSHTACEFLSSLTLRSPAELSLEQRNSGGSEPHEIGSPLDPVVPLSPHEAASAAGVDGADPLSKLVLSGAAFSRLRHGGQLPLPHDPVGSRVLLAPSTGNRPCISFSVLRFHKEADAADRHGSRANPFVSETVALQRRRQQQQVQQQLLQQERAQALQADMKLSRHPAQNDAISPLKLKGLSYAFLLDLCSADGDEHEAYDPFHLDDPALQSGKHRRVMHLPGFVESIIPFVRPPLLRRELNEQFALKHPQLSRSLTLSKIRAIKRELLSFAQEQDCELSTVALAHVYFEKLVLRNVVNKMNRKLMAAVSLVLAAKWNEPKVTSTIFHMVEKHYAIPRAVIFRSEFSVYVELSFRLQLLPSEVYPHFVRLLQALERTPQEYLGEAQYQAYAAEYLQPRVEPVEPVVEEPAFNER
eukprot:Transcript_2402.p1 GENE.Transcript_2402~~Transcript_2402.p1  ORF type:complete len:525 (+),score=247.95 Transcript_2402:110-1684(+)